MPTRRLVLLLLAAAILSCESPTSSPRSGDRPGRYPTAEGFAQLAVDDPCRYLGTLHNVSRQIVERYRARREVSIDEWACMSEVIVDVNYEVGIDCHKRDVPFEEFAARQEKGYLACLTDEHAHLASCAVIQVDEDGQAGFCK
jgi:hypothetical protein